MKDKRETRGYFIEIEKEMKEKEGVEELFYSLRRNQQAWNILWLIDHTKGKFQIIINTNLSR